MSRQRRTPRRSNCSVGFRVSGRGRGGGAGKAPATTQGLHDRNARSAGLHDRDYTTGTRGAPRDTTGAERAQQRSRLHRENYQSTFLKSTHTLRAQKWVPKRIISRNTAPPVPFLAPIRSATAGRALTRRPFVDRVGHRRVTDDFVSLPTTKELLQSYLGRDAVVQS